MWQAICATDISNPDATSTIRTITDVLNLAKTNLAKAQEHQAKYHDRHHRDVSFQIGDRVLLSTKNLRLASLALQPSRKFQPRYVGPFTITDQVSPAAFRLELPSTYRLPCLPSKTLRRIH